MKVKDVIKQIEADGGVEVRRESSHRTFKKKGVTDNVAVAGTDGEDVSQGVLSKLRRQDYH